MNSDPDKDEDEARSSNDITRWSVGSEYFDIRSTFRVVEYLGAGGSLLLVSLSLFHLSVLMCECMYVCMHPVSLWYGVCCIR